MEFFIFKCFFLLQIYLWIKLKSHHIRVFYMCGIWQADFKIVWKKNTKNKKGYLEKEEYFWRNYLFKNQGLLYHRTLEIKALWFRNEDEKHNNKTKQKSKNCPTTYLLSLWQSCHSYSVGEGTPFEWFWFIRCLYESKWILIPICHFTSKFNVRWVIGVNEIV